MKLTFEFDDSSLVSMKQLADEGFRFVEVIARNPLGQEERIQIVSEWPSQSDGEVGK